MGQYTSFEFDATLDQELPARLSDYLSRRLDPESYPANPTDEDVRNAGYDGAPFFNCQRWWWLLSPFGTKGYPSGSSSFRCYEEGCVLRIRTHFKNYDNEINLFLSWIAPWLDELQPTQSFGRFRKEDDEEWTAITGEMIAQSYRRNTGKALAFHHKIRQTPSFGL